MINIGVNLGLLPTKGLTLPFVSYGGSSMLACASSLGILLRISLENNTESVGSSSAYSIHGEASQRASAPASGLGANQPRGLKMWTNGLILKIKSRASFMNRPNNTTHIKRVLIMAAGTGGHVYPALATAAILKKEDWEVEWLGTGRGIEARLVPEAGFKLNCIDVVGLRGKGFCLYCLHPGVYVNLCCSRLKLSIDLSPTVFWAWVALSQGRVVWRPSC